MAKTILIFFPHRLKPGFGGAYSYLYHLQTALCSSAVQLQFLPDLISLPFDQEDGPKTPSVLKQAVKFLLPKKAVFSFRILRYLKNAQQAPFLRQLDTIDFSRYDAIHFHETIDLWRSLPRLKNFTGKIILTSHSPKPYHLELLEDVFGLGQDDISSVARQRLAYIDTFAFSRADLLLAPCKEAASSYKNSWPLFRTLTHGKNWAYVPTGIDPPIVTRPAEAIRKELGIGNDWFVVVFNGRHAAVKGFDLLVAAAKKLLPENHNLCFLVTGENENRPAVGHERWLETGWTNRPQDFVNAADLVVVPNRQTYFDLNVLQALSLGKPVLLSETGGNNYFHRFQCAGISFLPSVSVDGIVNAIGRAYKRRDRLASSVDDLQRLYQEQFSISRFAAQYEQFYLSI